MPYIPDRWRGFEIKIKDQNRRNELLLYLSTPLPSHYSYLDVPLPSHYSYLDAPLLGHYSYLGTTVPGHYSYSHHFYLGTPVPSHYSYLGMLIPGHYFYLGTKLFNLVFLVCTRYDTFAYKYTYPIVYKVPVTHIGDGAGLWAILCLPKKQTEFQHFSIPPPFSKLIRE